uniref:Uncharacterized protein n=1 Tax=Steinernema glaseri TaxID=37863 RepID=A0A1I7ZYI0_9BILA
MNSRSEHCRVTTYDANASQKKKLEVDDPRYRRTKNVNHLWGGQWRKQDSEWTVGVSKFVGSVYSRNVIKELCLICCSKTRRRRRCGQGFKERFSCGEPRNFLQCSYRLYLTS